MIGGTSGSGPELSSTTVDGISNSRLSSHSDRLLVSSGDCLQEWLERFADRLKGRINAVADEVQQVVDQMGAVEVNLQNTFNSFRCLSSSQFVENRVYEEDETEVASVGTPMRDSRQPSMPTESYEDEILPRYKDAVAIAWSAFQRANSQRDQTSERPKAQSKLRDSHRDEMFQLLPHIIGTEDFTRDAHCGLADLRWKHQVTDDTESDIDGERDGADLVAGLIGSGIPSEGEEASGSESDASAFEEGGLEPAVSAALDFKAMLEAALRNSSLPYGGGTSNDLDNVYGEFGDNNFSLPNLTNDNNSPRTISTMVDIIGRTMSTMDRKDELHNNTSELSNATVKNSQLPLAGHQQSTSEGDPAYPLTIEDLLKQPVNSQTQAMLNRECKQFFDNNGGSQQVETRGLGQTPIIPGALFDDEESDTGFMTKEYSVLPSSSNTGPTVPEVLFQKQLSLDLPQHTRTESQSSNSFDSSQVVRNFQHSPVNTVTGTSDQDSDLERKGSDKSQLTISPPVPKHSASPQSGSSSISSVSNVIAGSQHSGALLIRGGLFDDDDDEDEDPGDLFGASAPSVERQPSLRPWASRSSKGLFDDIKDIDTQQDAAIGISDEAQSSHEGQRNNNIASFPTSQFEPQSRHGALDSHGQPVDSVSPKLSLRTIHLDLVTPSDPKEIKINSQIDVGEEKIQSPIQSKLVAAVRSSAPLRVDSDEELWSNSESEDDSVIQGKGETAQHISQNRAPLDVLETNESETNSSQGGTAESVYDLKPAASVVASDHLAHSLTSTEKTSQVAIHEEGGNSGSSTQLVHEVPPVRLPQALSRSFSATEASPVKVAIKLADSPLLQSKRRELSDSDESDPDSGSTQSHSQRIGQPQPVHTTFPHTVGPSEQQASSLVEPTSENVTETPTFSSQNSVEANKMNLEDVRKTSSRGLPVPASEFERLTSRRTFTPLFEDDDAEEDLFGRNTNIQGGLFPGTGKHTTRLASNTTFAASLGGHDRILKIEAPLLTQDVVPQFPQTSNSPADSSITSHAKHVKNTEGNMSLTKSSSKLSSLLFGDDDEESENALFGTLGGRTSQRSNGSKSEKAVSLFGDTSLPSTFCSPSTQGRSLFDD